MQILYVDMENVLVDFPSGITRLSSVVQAEYEDNHLEASNRGNVQVTIKSAEGIGQNVLQIRRIERPEEAKWIEPEKLPLVAETNSLRHHHEGYVIAQNAFYEEVEAIAPPGNYWLKESNLFENGKYTVQAAILSHAK